MKVVLITLLIFVVSCATTQNRKPEKSLDLCLEPEPPIYEKIFPEDPQDVKIKKTLNNIVKVKSYAEKLKNTVDCLKNLTKTEN